MSVENGHGGEGAGETEPLLKRENGVEEREKRKEKRESLMLNGESSVSLVSLVPRLLLENPLILLARTNLHRFVSQHPDQHRPPGLEGRSRSAVPVHQSHRLVRGQRARSSINSYHLLHSCRRWCKGDQDSREFAFIPTDSCWSVETRCL